MRYWSRHQSLLPVAAPRPNTTSNLELKHYPDPSARPVSEADVANEVKDLQLELLSAQLLNEADT
ncbi:MAG: hypothetical protein EON58_14515 [Alphaproteobacteria bacterium]|nr:MAG: hypothetical protein EON58_14515 [Alphaproteobacteria bacterium]